MPHITVGYYVFILYSIMYWYLGLLGQCQAKRSLKARVVFIPKDKGVPCSSDMLAVFQRLDISIRWRSIDINNRYHQMKEYWKLAGAKLNKMSDTGYRLRGMICNIGYWLSLECKYQISWKLVDMPSLLILVWHWLF